MAVNLNTSAPRFEIRPALPLDAKSIREIWNQYITETSVTFTTQIKSADEIADAIMQRGDLFLVCQDHKASNQIVGFATAFAFRAGPGYARTYEHSILLAPKFSGQGAGRTLMSTLENTLREKNAHCLFSGVSAENPAAIQFHHKIGFKVAARLPEVGYKFGRYMDLVLMQKFL